MNISLDVESEGVGAGASPPGKKHKNIRRNTIWITLGQGGRLFIQAAYFTLIARSLGVSNYGAFVGAVALVGSLYPFGALGRGNLLIKSVTRDQSTFGRAWGDALLTTWLVGPILTGVVFVAAHFLLPPSVPKTLALVVALSDILGLNLITISGQAFQSFERLGWTATINALISASRLTGALILYAFNHHPSVLQWGYMYLATTAVVTVFSCLLVSVKLGWPAFHFPDKWGEFVEGIYFSISLAAQTIYNDIDKTMLVKLSTLAASGIYGAAYRIIDVSFAPVSAALYATYPGLFREGASGLAASLAYAKPVLKKAGMYAGGVTCALLLGAGLVPYVLGKQFHDSAEALRWLAPLPILKAGHYFISDSLAGAGHQRERSFIQIGVAVFNILLNLWIIPRYSWRGAAWSSLASDGLLLLSVATLAWIILRRELAQASLSQQIA
jgi:O-antigen/teichoic acid export membrane protein